MNPSEFERAAIALARPCVYLRDKGHEYAGVWGGSPAGPSPPGRHRHWLSVDARHLPGPMRRSGVLSIFTNENDRSGVAALVPDAQLPSRPDGLRLFAAPGISLPPVEGVFAFGGAAIEDWLRTLAWEDEWAYNANFPARDVVEPYEDVLHRECPLYTGGAHAALGGWHFPWPDGDWAQLAKATLLAWTFADSEPWVEAWADDGRTWVLQRIT